MPLPLCFDGRVASISLDDDELIALDTARRIYTMDNALKDASAFNWTNRWGTPFWTGPGLHAARRRQGLVVVGDLAARGRELDRPGGQPDGDRRRQGLAHLGPARAAGSG